ncbi:uncharacterized protein VTP21DRAFT_1704 [Calcarisporiella thermophila]|uniref:uncharacterized protein n=1 Tax=Calcarisporiella thermophila TaxID=911321 RepID=UPI003742C37C
MLIHRRTSHHPLLVFTLISWIAFVCFSREARTESLFLRRDEAACTELTQIVCSPQAGEIWANGSHHNLIWNTRNQEIAPSLYVDIYLIFLENGVEVVVKHFQNVMNNGIFPLDVDSTWYPASKPPGPVDRPLSYMWQIVRAGDPRDSLGSGGPAFSIVQPAAAPRVAIVTESIASTMIIQAPQVLGTSNSAGEEGSRGDELQPLIVGIISAACVCVMFAVGLGLVLWRRRTRKQGLTSESDISLTDPEGSEKNQYVPSLRVTTASSPSSSTKDTPSPISWPPSENAASISSKEGETEEERRRRGEELLRRELENNSVSLLETRHTNRRVLMTAPVVAPSSALQFEE